MLKISLRLIVIVVLAVLLSYSIAVYIWSIPEDETNRANLILGGCESRSIESWENWMSRSKLVPPPVRCVVRFFTKEQILSARFPRPAEKIDESTLQFYVSSAFMRISIENSTGERFLPKVNLLIRSIDWLIENGADANQCNVDGITALHVAAYYERWDYFESWRQHGADPNLSCFMEAPSSSIGSPNDWKREREKAN